MISQSPSPLQMKTNKQSITQIPVNNSLKTSSYMVSVTFLGSALVLDLSGREVI